MVKSLQSILFLSGVTIISGNKVYLQATWKATKMRKIMLSSMKDSRSIYIAKTELPGMTVMSFKAYSILQKQSFVFEYAQCLHCRFKSPDLHGYSLHQSFQ